MSMTGSIDGRREEDQLDVDMHTLFCLTLSLLA